MEGGEEEEVTQGRVLQRGRGRGLEDRNGAKEVGKSGVGGDDREGMRGGGT